VYINIFPYREIPNPKSLTVLKEKLYVSLVKVSFAERKVLRGEKRKKMNTKNVILAMAIAAVFLVAAVGSASANGVCVGEHYKFACWSPYSNVVNESCTFNGSMECPSGDGLIIGADNITIDGNGYILDGVNSACTGGMSVVEF
jgi:hypothetical protein